MNHTDIRSLASGMAPVVRGYVEQAVSPLLARLESLESELKATRAERDEQIARSAELSTQWDAKFDALEVKMQDAVNASSQASLQAMMDLEIQTDERGQTAAMGWTAQLEQLDAKCAEAMERLDAKLATAVPASEAADANIQKLVGGLQPDTAYVDEQTSGLRADIAELRTQLAARPEPEPVPDVQRMVDEAVAGLPVAKDGEPGKDADLDIVRVWIAEEVSKIPAPQDGSSVTLADVAPLVSEAVQRAVEAMPVAKDGVGVAGAIIDRSGRLILTLTDGTVRELGQVVGKDGRDGTDGQNGARGEPGFNLDDFDVDIKDERTIVLKFARGDTLETYELGFPVVIYRGVYKDDQAYEQGDMVSRGGNLYHCNAPTTDKPESGSEAWTLSARRGRDGKDGLPGPKGEPGQKGDPGLNGRNWT